MEREQLLIRSEKRIQLKIQEEINSTNNTTHFKDKEIESEKNLSDESDSRS